MKEQRSYKLSPSSINIMLDCPKCFWLQIVKKIKRPEGIFPSLPSGMDKVLKIHFDKFMKEGLLPPEVRDIGLSNGYKLFEDKEQLDIWRSNFEGIQYKDKTSGILLRGAIDNLMQKGKKLIVLDYKTRGFPLKEDTATHYQAQMDIYNFLLRKNGYETEDYAYLLFYHPKEVSDTGELIFNTDLVKMETSAKRGGEIFEKAIKILELKKPPKSAEDCKFCEYRENENI